MDPTAIIKALLLIPGLAGKLVRPSAPRVNIRGGNRHRYVSVNPPAIQSNIVANHTYRYLSTATVPKQVTSNTLLGAVGGMCIATNTAVQSFASSVKINSITIRSPPASQGASSTASIEWSGNQFAPDKEISDTTISVASPSKVHSRPPRMSTASFWQTSSTTNLCTLVAPAGAIIDINVSFVLSDNTNTGFQSTVSTGILGTVYYLALDGPATNLFVPVSMTTTH